MTYFRTCAIAGALILSPLAALAAPVTIEGTPGGSIVINDNDGVAAALAIGAQFTNVVRISTGCSGALINATTVVTARHCFDSFDTSNPGTVSAIFSDAGGNVTNNIAATSVNIVGGINDPLLDGGDLAIVQLSAAVMGVTPLRFTDQIAPGDSILAIGFGLNGTGSQGHQFTSDNERWGAANVVDVVGNAVNSGGSIPGTANIISTDFDDGTAGNNTLSSFGSSANPVPFEGTTAPGDSGGPLLVQRNGEWLIAGVLSGGTTNTSVYGDISWWTSTTDGANRAFVESFGAQFANSAVVPLPAGGVLLLGGLMGLGLLRKRAA